MDENAPSNIDAGQAFEALRAEVSLLRRALEGLTAERQAAPDYAPTLSEISTRIDGVRAWAQKMADQPAMRLTPKGLTQEIDAASRELRQADKQTIMDVGSRLGEHITRVDAIIKRSRTADQQVRLVHKVAASGVVVGMILFAILPGAIARAMPESWLWPEQRAAKTMGRTGWSAGMRLLQVSDPGRWRAQQQALVLMKANEVAIKGCWMLSLQGKESVRCSINVEAPGS